MADMNEIPGGNSGILVHPHGLLLLNKPPGPTSFDCIRFLRRTCNLPPKWKLGHLGTLDPFASGVMIIALGQAVRYSSFGLKSDKCYRARLWLGDETDTLDPTGNVTDSQTVPPGWKDKLDDIAAIFTGTIEQTPPAFSARHINGKRSYELARKGETPELKPTTVEIYSLQFTGSDENWVDFVCHVSGGTYIRSLASDIARELGTVGHLLGLERTRSGKFPIGESIPFPAFETGGAQVLMHHLKPVTRILDHLPALIIKTSIEEKLLHGKALEPDDLGSEFPEPTGDAVTFRIMDENENFRALGRFNDDSSSIIPFKPWLV